ncbi:MAG TPA: GNAT family N-acetyltransferase [Acidimicrobiales bacterium]|nr:GNAT family N-acetyltransferase [Acidimicrobiales bacterium]
MIRAAEPSDVPDLLRLIRALADYEREPDAVEATENDLIRSLFGPTPVARADVAVIDGRVVGMAVWFLSFSTWTGRPSLYLEDLFVEPVHRASGLGRQLLSRLASTALELGCARMDWSVLDWNEPAMGFYRAIGAQPMTEWTTWRLTGDALQTLAGHPPA